MLFRGRSYRLALLHSGQTLSLHPMLGNTGQYNDTVAAASSWRVWRDSIAHETHCLETNTRTHRGADRPAITFPPTDERYCEIPADPGPIKNRNRSALTSSMARATSHILQRGRRSQHSGTVHPRTLNRSMAHAKRNAQRIPAHCIHRCKPEKLCKKIDYPQKHHLTNGRFRTPWTATTRPFRKCGYQCKHWTHTLTSEPCRICNPFWLIVSMRLALFLSASHAHKSA